MPDDISNDDDGMLSQEDRDFLAYVQDKQEAEDDTINAINREAEFERRSNYDEDDPLRDDRDD